MVKQSQVSVGWQIAFMFMPYVWIIAFYKIEKLRMGILLLLGAIGISIPLQMILPFPYGFGLTLIGAITLPIYFIREWSIEWNNKFISSSESRNET